MTTFSGRLKEKSSVDLMLSGMGQPPLPATQASFLGNTDVDPTGTPTLRDPNNDEFARLGIND